MENNKAELEAVYHSSCIVAAIDLIAATICAVNGNILFAPFMVMAALMWIYGIYFKAKADKIGE
jgi:hypothetical protein